MLEPFRDGEPRKPGEYIPGLFFRHSPGFETLPQLPEQPDEKIPFGADFQLQLLPEHPCNSRAKARGGYCDTQGHGGHHGQHKEDFRPGRVSHRNMRNGPGYSGRLHFVRSAREVQIYRSAQRGLSHFEAPC